MATQKNTKPRIRILCRAEIVEKLTERFPAFELPMFEVLIGVKAIAHDIDAQLLDSLAPYDLSEGKFFVLGQLLQLDLLHEPPPHPSGLADSLGVTRATITGLLDGLERSGLVRRTVEPDDRRSCTVCLTDNGRRLMDEMVPKTLEANMRLGTRLTPEEQATLVALLKKLEPTGS